jgi:16S rRNA (adenine1518-N6/adenine1519-N6)-dimethyltransferase
MELDQPAPLPRKVRLRQTLSYLHELFAQHGIQPKSKLGQNFLIDLNVLDLIVRAAELTPADLVLEVGTGTGGLTEQLAERAAAVLSVEIDPHFHSLAQELLGERTNVRLLHTDVLKNKNHFDPEVLAALAELREQHPGAPLKLVANLPYVVATPVIANFLISDIPIERFVVTVQWEMAERLMARRGTKDYGALAVLVQSLADVYLVRKLPPSVFWPRPAVESAIVEIRPRPNKRQHVGDVERFRNFLRDLYTHRRKNLRTALASLPRGRLAKSEVDGKLKGLGLDGTIRAEDLTREEHLRLCEVFGWDADASP